jgi:SNF2 family DNA or RNA helicase
MGVFNEQRTGKTPTSLIAMEQKGVNRLLIVCPASMVYKWADECEQWLNKKAGIIGSAVKFNANPTTLDYDIIIINYENLRDSKKNAGAWQLLLKKFKPDGFIVDEVHRCKDRNSANFKAIKKFKHVPYRLYLTGTPAPNKQEDIWTILHLICPELFNSYWEFIHQFFEEEIIFVAGNMHTEPTHLKVGMDIYLQNVLNSISVMRKRKNVMPWLPKEEMPTVIKLPCTATQRKYITELETTFETEHINTQSILEQLVRIRQICAAPAILHLKGESPKIEWLKQYISDYPDKSIIVFSNSKKFLNVVCSLVKCSIITGDTAPKIRQQHIVDFQNETTRVLVIQTQAGKEGLTLDKADTTIFLDTYPPAADYMQAKDRMIPVIPEHVKPQEIIHLMMQDTYDEQLYNLVAKGVSDTEVINDYINYIKERREQHG